jgi:hypothetical protein
VLAVAGDGSFVRAVTALRSAAVERGANLVVLAPRDQHERVDGRLYACK